MFESILGPRKAVKALPDFHSEWPNVIRNGSAKVIMPGRVNLAAPGTRLMAIRASDPIFMCGFMWGFSAHSAEDEKLLTLWLNTAVFFFQLLSLQTVTEGSWVKLHSKHFAKAQVLDMEALSRSVKDRLLELYDEMKYVKWPSLLDQYSSPPKERRRLDAEVLKVLGVSTAQVDGTLDAIYAANAKTLRTMKATMTSE